MYILFQSDLLLSLFTIFNELRGHSYRQVNAQNREKKKKNTNFTSFINMSQREYRLEIIKSYMNHGDILTKRRQVSLPSCEIGGASTCLWVMTATSTQVLPPSLESHRAGCFWVSLYTILFSTSKAQFILKQFQTRKSRHTECTAVDEYPALWPVC